MAVFADALPVLDIPLQMRPVSGKADPAYAASVIRWIETATGLALSGEVSGLVTAPIAKAPLYAAGFGFAGHTEFLAELSAGAPQDGARGPVMMLTARGLRTALVTIHEPLNKVASLLTIEAVVNVGLVTAQALPRFRRRSAPPGHGRPQPARRRGRVARPRGNRDPDAGGAGAA